MASRRLTPSKRMVTNIKFQPSNYSKRILVICNFSKEKFVMVQIAAN
uniref:Uncharacterized protein n=1 Tax=Nelumbo nucifera TaxID=4432 RepID=A0A822Z516_NELNU|nr:TPA_asm: hypothetical protein HUJ06_008737 [Nelumbo nucifera]